MVEPKPQGDLRLGAGEAERKILGAIGSSKPCCVQGIWSIMNMPRARCVPREDLRGSEACTSG